MDKYIPNSAVSHYLDDVTEQIAYKPLRPSIRQELEAHIEDHVKDYQDQGLSAAEAEQQAIHSMGDALAIGTELNGIHQIQKTPWLALATALLLLSGFALSSFMQWSPEQTSNGFLYYIPGGLLLLFTVFKGYPFLIRHRKGLAILLIILYLALIALIVHMRVNNLWFGMVGINYFATLAFAPLTAILLYCVRHNRKKILLTSFVYISVWLVLTFSTVVYVNNTAIVILLLSTLCTIIFMIHRGILPGRKKYLYTITLAVTVLLGSPFFISSYGRYEIRAFLFPQTAVISVWHDAYNGILIQELLSRTPLIGNIELTPDEMMNYGTGEWYFNVLEPISIDASGLNTERQGQEFQARVQAMRESGYSPKYIHYTASNVTLWNILPQHYHNNYLIAVCIFLFGWLPGLALILIIGLFYTLMFSCIRKIHGHLASVLTFACGQCLLWQGIFYLLGNFGYQYNKFPNMPMISEGRISIIFNMMFLGLIISAYRYDHVIENPLELNDMIPEH